jgi:hypothetical protein
VICNFIAAVTKHADWAGVVVNLATLIVVGFYTRYARRQNELAAEQNRHTENALIYSKRSWLVVDGTPDIQLKAGFNTITATARPKNVGDVPVSRIRYECQFVLGLLPDKPRLGAFPSQSTAVIVKGEEEVRWLQHCAAIELTEEDLVALHGEQRDLHFYWLVEYGDCFNKTWRTVKVWRVDPRSLLNRWRETVVHGWNQLE